MQCRLEQYVYGKHCKFGKDYLCISTIKTFREFSLVKIIKIKDELCLT